MTSVRLMMLCSAAWLLTACPSGGEHTGTADGDVETMCEDGQDNDGDGVSDCQDADCEGRVCDASRPAFCRAGQCAGGEVGALCADGLDNDADGASDCDDVDCEGSCACGECAEQCGNGADDDEDGVVDEGCPCPFANSTVGVCAKGSLDFGGLCSPPAGHQLTEVACDGVDNDCDGATDEGCLCAFGEREQGVCAISTTDLSGNCEQPASFQAEETACDGLDNDCDGAVDKGCSTCDFMETSQGVCAFGRVGASAQSCLVPVTWQQRETLCDGVDNDCDGVTDEGCPCRFRGRQFGPCVRSVTDDAGECAEPVGFEDDELECDGLDNDCDGEIDEGCVRCAFERNPFGACRFGRRANADGEPLVCEAPVTFERTETSCFDLQDNDCDGFADAADDDCDGGERCADGRDNDGDGLIDCDDPECAGQECGRRVFATQRQYSANLSGGAAGVRGWADELCAEEAREAGIDGEWAAVLALEDEPASSRLELAGPVFASDRLTTAIVGQGEAFFDSGSTKGAMGFSASGRAVDNLAGVLEAQDEVWSGSGADGAQVVGETCSGWSSASPTGDGAVGRVGSLGQVVCPCSAHLNAETRSCDGRARLLCISGQPVEQCGMSGDADRDGLTSDVDPDCFEGTEVCEDGIDNDANGQTDCDDASCAGKTCGHVLFSFYVTQLLGKLEEGDDRCRAEALLAGYSGTFEVVPRADSFSMRVQAADLDARLDALRIDGKVFGTAPWRPVIAQTREAFIGGVRSGFTGAWEYNARRLPSREVSRTVPVLCIGGQ